MARPAARAAGRGAGDAHGKPGRAGGAGRIARTLLQRLASRGRCQSRRRDVSRSEPLSGQQRTGSSGAPKQRARAARSDRIARGARRIALVPADRRRRRGRLRRSAQRLRVDEGIDSGRRSRGSLRRSVELRKEVRPLRRQSADSHTASRAAFDSGAACRRRARRFDGPDRTHRRELREAGHQRRRSERSCVPYGRTHAGRILRDDARHRVLHRARLSLRALRRSALDGNLGTEPRRSAPFRRRDSRAPSGQTARL